MAHFPFLPLSETLNISSEMKMICQKLLLGDLQKWLEKKHGRHMAYLGKANFKILLPDRWCLVEMITG